jgi:hypothetical protein
MVSAEVSIPNLIDIGTSSLKTESSCWSTNDVGTGWTPWTPVVFWAVRPVRTDAP